MSFFRLLSRWSGLSIFSVAGPAALLPRSLGTMHRVRGVERPRQKRVAQAVLMALSWVTLVVALPVSAQSTAASERRQHYEIAAGPLERVLLQFSQRSGLVVEASPSLLSGRQSKGVAGSWETGAALQALLQGTGLAAKQNVQGQWVLTVTDSGAGKGKGAPNDDPVMPTVTVLGTNLKTDVQAYPGSVSVLSADKLENYSSVIAAMADVPGVTTGGDSGRVTGEQFNIRGFGYQSEDRVIVLQDGVRRSPALYSNHVSSFRSDNDLLKRVEVVKGASSVQNGGGAIGGVVAMTTKEAGDFIPTGKDMGFATKMRYESNNYREAYVAAALAPQEQPYELLVYGKKGSAGDLKMSRPFAVDAKGNGIDSVNNDENLTTAFIQAAIKPSSNQKISLSHYEYKLQNETTWQTLYHPNYSSVTGPVKGDLRQQDTVLKYRFIDPDNAWISLNASLYYSAASYDRGYAYIDTRTKKTTQLDYDNQDKRYGFRLNNESLFETGSVQHRLVTGMDYERRKEDATYLLNGVYTVFGSMPNTYKDTGVYYHLESTFGKGWLTTHFGGRYDQFDRRVDKNAGGFKGNHFSPRLGASLQVVEGMRLLANWSESFRAPTPHETSSEGPLNPHYWYLPNPGLKPETIREYELGASYERKGVLSSTDSFDTKLMYFNGRIKDMIVFGTTRNNEVSPQNSPYGTYMNVNRAKRHGVEWQASYRRRDGGVTLGYSTLSQKDEATGQDVPQSFANKLSLDAYVLPRAGWKFGGNVTHWFKPSANPVSILSGGTTYWYVRKDYTITNLYAQWQPNPGGRGALGQDLSIRFGVNNLFDASYLNARDVETTTRVGKGRNFFLNLETRF